MTVISDSITRNIKTRKDNFLIVTLILLTVILFTGIFYFYNLTNAPKEQSYPISIQIEKGMTVKNISELAEQKGLVRSGLLLYSLLTSLYDPTNIYAGRYIVEEPSSVFNIAKKLASNDIDEPLITVTIPEGITAKQMAVIADALLPEFDTEVYLQSAGKNEGYLFPETYFVPETYTANDFFELQSKTFSEKVNPIEVDAPTSSLLTFDEVIILASIVEREANDEESMKAVAGILLNRLELGMPLQADAAIEYVIEVPLNELKPGELAKYLQTVDSPYNLYKNKGLPPTPIGNPGLMAIDAVLNPVASDYYYYITGNDGVFYYAETLSEHNRNIDTYLR